MTLEESAHSSDESEHLSQHSVVMLQNHCQSRESAHLAPGLIPIHTNVHPPS